jgi:hypothetical protein
MPVGESLGDLVDQHAEPRALIETLVGAGRDLDAVRFLVYCLPPRESVWLACLAARNAGESDAAALDAAEQWVYKPDEEKRRSARAALERAEPGSPAAMAALAAFYSGGNIGPEGAPEIPPPAGLAARLVEGAVIVACTHDDPDTAATLTRRLLEQAVDIAGGGSGRRPDTPA